MNVCVRMVIIREQRVYCLEVWSESTLWPTAGRTVGDWCVTYYSDSLLHSLRSFTLSIGYGLHDNKPFLVIVWLTTDCTLNGSFSLLSLYGSLWAALW